MSGVASFSYDDMAKYLKIRVDENGKTKVQLTMKRSVVENLRDIIPDDTMVRIEEQGISVEEILEHTRKNLYKPSELFHLTIPEMNKEIRVWLE